MDASYPPGARRGPSLTPASSPVENSPVASQLEPSDNPSVKLLLSLPEDALVAGELELVLAHLAGLIDRVITPEVDPESQDGDDAPWP